MRIFLNRGHAPDHNGAPREPQGASDMNWTIDCAEIRIQRFVIAHQVLSVKRHLPLVRHAPRIIAHRPPRRPITSTFCERWK